MLYIENTEQRGTGIENGPERLIERSISVAVQPRKVFHLEPIFRNFSGWTEPIHSDNVLVRNFRKFWLNGSRPPLHEPLLR